MDKVSADLLSFEELVKTATPYKKLHYIVTLNLFKIIRPLQLQPPQPKKLLNKI
jgi:hypothetical protein